jgi:hypothetical protein
VGLQPPGQVRPYEVDGSKLCRRFGFEVTPLETGARETARWFAERASRALAESMQHG